MGAGQTTTTVESASHEACGHERMCVVCRKRRAPEQLLRVCLKGGLLRFDRKTEKGRSGWLCPDRDCLENLSAQMIGRALKVPKFRFPDDFNALEYLRARANQVVLELLGLARRAGKLRVGMESVSRAGLSEDGESFIIAANDLSERSQKLYQERLGPWSGAELARAIGLDRVGVLAIEPSGFAIDAHFWFGLLRSLSPQVEEIRG